jgi:hypothetical protein
VVQRGEVDEFDGDGRIDDVVVVRIAEAGGEQHEVRAGAFSAGGQQMLRCLVRQSPRLFGDLVETASTVSN